MRWVSILYYKPIKKIHEIIAPFLASKVSRPFNKRCDNYLKNDSPFVAFINPLPNCRSMLNVVPASSGATLLPVCSVCPPVIYFFIFFKQTYNISLVAIKSSTSEHHQNRNMKTLNQFISIYIQNHWNH